jgi:hypothetical protein
LTPNVSGLPLNITIVPISENVTASNMTEVGGENATKNATA